MAAIFERIPLASADDGWADLNDVWTDDTGYIWLGNDAGEDEEGACRFDKVYVPKDATITAAYVTGDINSNLLTSDCVIKLSMEDADDPAVITSNTDFGNRVRTTASTNWTITAAMGTGTQQSPSLVDEVQEIVDRSGWVWGQAMTLLIDTVTVTAGEDFAFETFDWSSGAGLILHIEYTAPGATIQKKSATVTSGSTVGVTFDSTATEDNLLVLSVVTGSDGITTPGGYTLGRVQESDNDQWIGIYYKVAAGSETGVTVTCAASEEHALAFQEIQDPVTTSPQDKVNSFYQSATTETDIQAGSTGTLAQAQEFVIAALGPHWDPDNDFTVDEDFEIAFDLHNGSSLNALTVIKITAATTALNPTMTWDGGDGDGWVNAAIATYKLSTTSALQAYNGTSWDAGVMKVWDSAVPQTIEIAGDNNDAQETITSLTIAVDSGIKSNRAIVVAASSYDGGGDPPTPTATYDAVSMTQLATTGQGASRGTLFGLDGIDTGSNDVVVTWSSEQNEGTVVAVAFSGVDQTTPFGTATAEESSSVTEASIDITSATDDLVVDAFYYYNVSGVTIGANQTQRASYEGGAGLDSIHISTEPGVTTTTMSWTFDSDNVAQIAVNINVAPDEAEWVEGVLKAYNGSTWVP